MIEMRQLVIFRAVARSGSFSAAARQLGYTQPAVSQQIKAMERTLGTPLVVRSARRLQLTEAGEALCRHAVTILGVINTAQAEIQAIAGLKAGRVRVVAFPSACSALVPKAIALTRKAHPDLRVTLVEAEPPEAVGMLRAGDCEVAVAFDHPGRGGADQADVADVADVADLSVHTLFTEPLSLLLPPGHRLSGSARTEPVRLAELARESWIAGCPQCRGHLVDACKQAGFHPDIDYATDDSPAAAGLVAEGLGVALVPRLTVLGGVPAGVKVCAVEPPMERRVTAVTLPGLNSVPAVKAMIELLKKASSIAFGE
ncbi:LysR family transcriptional regulator [Streptomyces sp. H34-S4]|uniref:LysR family transcriptional regulator n=1 Tax=Streptomyces sp. H34-S4 TaxID=2996463 RepID=UPI00226F2BE9|nr:LysR family transcriptional regulator [Streptomyces sp. H34-S4]MCY0938556.1 LysR family transcriptional regulator [Streptomyces sp. H34-S4]